jgi:hypothetical protein
LGIGDWGLGIGDWAQSPIPMIKTKKILNFIIYIIKRKIISKNIIIFIK